MNIRIQFPKNKYKTNNNEISSINSRVSIIKSFVFANNNNKNNNNNDELKFVQIGEILKEKENVRVFLVVVGCSLIDAVSDLGFSYYSCWLLRSVRELSKQEQKQNEKKMNKTNIINFFALKI